MKDGQVLTLTELARRAREARGDETQREAAERLELQQSQISEAENGVQRYAGTCIRIIEEYTGFTVERPLFRLRKK